MLYRVSFWTNYCLLQFALTSFYDTYFAISLLLASRQFVFAWSYVLPEVVQLPIKPPGLLDPIPTRLIDPVVTFNLEHLLSRGCWQTHCALCETDSKYNAFVSPKVIHTSTLPNKTVVVCALVAVCYGQLTGRYVRLASTDLTGNWA
jgi:hypothetical protein